MARNGSGVYSLPSGSTVTNGDTSTASDINTPFQDLETDMNTPRPIVAGGTGAASASAARVNLGVAATVESKSSNYTAILDDRAKHFVFTAAATLNLTAAATLGDGWFCHILADGGNVVINPSGSETVNGSTTETLYDGEGGVLFCDGTALSIIKSAPFSAALRSFAGVSPSANQMTYANGTNSYTTTTLTSYARGLLDDTSSSEARTTTSTPWIPDASRIAIINSGSGATFTVPAAGTWFVYINQFNVSTGAAVFAQSCTVVAGGSVLGPPAAGVALTGFIWRIS